MGRTRVLVLLGIFSGSFLFLIASGCVGLPTDGQSTASFGNPGMGGSAGGSGSGINGGPGGAAIASSRFMFGGPGFESGSIQAGTIDSKGSVSTVAGSPFSTGLGQSSILQVTADVQGRFVFVLNSEAAAAGTVIANPGITGFVINQQTGMLTMVPGSPIVFAQNNDNQMAEDNTGHFLFQPNGTSTSFDVYSINQSSGRISKAAAGSNAPPAGMFTVASPAMPLLFNAGNNLVAVYSLNPQNGQLAIVPGTPTSSGGSGGPMAVTADGRFLYVANQTEGNVMVFSVGAMGKLAPVPGSPFTIDTRAQRLALTPEGKFLYVVAAPTSSSGTMQTVKGYAVNPTAGKFTPIPASFTNMSTANLDHSGKFVYISSASGGLTTYSIDPNTGALTPVSQSNAVSSDDANDIVTVP